MRPLRQKICLSVGILLTGIFPAEQLYAQPIISCQDGFPKLTTDFDGARAGQCVRLEKDNFEIQILPENTPINPSPWYAFDLETEVPQTISITLNYENAEHRYKPKMQNPDGLWYPLPESSLNIHEEGQKAVLTVTVPKGQTRIAAQEVIPIPQKTSYWTDYATDNGLDFEIIGRSERGQPIVSMTRSSSKSNAPLIVITGGQHPPEVPGRLGLKSFLAALFENSSNKTELDNFEFLIVPEMNPDGVKDGNWRHNANGLDLNRDWGPFSQPETQAVRGQIQQRVKAGITPYLLLDFHATRRNVIYTQPDHAGLKPENFARRWHNNIDAVWDKPVPARSASHNPDLPTAKTWFSETYKAPAITVEFADEINRAELKDLSAAMARGLLLTLQDLTTEKTPPTRPAGDIFGDVNRNNLVMEIEAAIAQAQSEYGIISASAAAEIARKADVKYAPIEEIANEYELVRHRMVALLNVWRKSLSPEAANALHNGVTTVDIYDTVLTLQLLDTIDILLGHMLIMEDSLVCLAESHKNTPMMGRTLGQHALPITFGKKVTGWAGVNRRNMDRLYDLRDRLKGHGTLKGAVGTHLGLGPDGYEIEKRTSELLGLGLPAPADDRAARDKFGEYAAILAVLSRSYANIGNEIFHLQMTDIGEVYEQRRTTAVGSSTMPHKRNPSLSEQLIHHGRVISGQSDILLEDMVNHFERDNTSRPIRSLESLAQTGMEMMEDVNKLIQRLEIRPERMRENMERTGGMIMAQRLVFFLAEDIPRHQAEERVRHAANLSLESDKTFKAALLEDNLIGPKLSGQLDDLLDPTTYIGLSAQQVTETRNWISEQRISRDQPNLKTCSE